MRAALSIQKTKGQRGEALPLDFMDWIGGSDDAATSSDTDRTLLGDLLAVAALAIGGDRIDRASRAAARLGQNWFHIGTIGPLQRIRGHQRIVPVLISAERLAVDQQCLCVGPANFIGARDQALDWIGDIVRLVDHVGGMEIFHAAIFRIDQFVEHKEQPVGVDRAGIQIVIAILGIVEMEAAEFLELD
jgi:hypothetical protein